jgi:hypothetical protein
MAHMTYSGRGVYLTDLTFIEDGNPDYVNELINFSKRSLIYTVIAKIQQFQVHIHVHVLYVDVIIDYLA